MNKTLALCLIGTVGLWDVACGDSSGPGGGSNGTTGKVQVFATDQPGATGNVSVMSPMLDRQGTANAEGYSGSLSGQMSVQIQTTAGAWVNVGSPSNVTLTAHGSDSANVSGTASVPVGTYTSVRLVWHNASAHLLAGSVFGGLTLSVDVDVMIGGPDSVVIEKSMTPFTVTADANTQTQIVFHLNSDAWLTEQSVQSRTCSESSVDAAVTAVARAEAS